MSHLPFFLEDFLLINSTKVQEKKFDRTWVKNFGVRFSFSKTFFCGRETAKKSDFEGGFLVGGVSFLNSEILKLYLL